MSPKRSLESIEVTHLDEVIQLTTSIKKTHVNGDIIINCYQVLDEDVIYCVFNENGYKRNLQELFLSPAIAMSIPCLKLEKGIQHEPDFEQCYVFEL
ncbi:hypothetical protein IC619_002785 [Hazenella sp. IB182353]|uniref:hypothetical protein n=1 Tax=Polycladospora coralii TaxID=2771432 RepID=UPI0017470C35|nr:hypothetical protein [Polycladospora coralii]MBS7529423.1 hypothetical protein [Polycladospora coralii]